MDTFKALVSGERLQARELYGNPFTLKNKVKFIMNTNELPREIENTEAYFRRYMIIPFETIIKEKDRDIHLAEKIIATDLPGIFNWVLAGLKRLVSNERFIESEKVNQALITWKKYADNVALFIDEFRYIPSESTKIIIMVLYKDYTDFCKDSGYKPLGKYNFSARFEHKGFIKGRSNDGSYCFFLEVGPI